MVFAKPQLDIYSYNEPFDFAFTNADPAKNGTAAMLSSQPFSISKGAYTITLNATAGSLNGDNVLLGLLANGPDANGYSRAAASASFPFLVRLGTQIFEITAIVSDTQFRTRNAARANTRGMLFSQSAHPLTGEKIRIPSMRESSDASIRLFGSAFGSVLPSLGFKDLEAQDLTLVGHITKSQYQNAFLGGVLESVSFPTEYKAKGRFAHTVRNSFTSLKSTIKSSNPGGALELHTHTPLGNSTEAGLITAIVASASRRPEVREHNSIDEAAYILRLQSKNTTSLLNTSFTAIVEDGKELVLLDKSNAGAVAFQLMSKLGKHVQLSKCEGNFPGILKFTITSKSGAPIDEALHARIGLRISYMGHTS
jgi:hypothetical protein